MSNKAQLVKPEKYNENDRIIALMGPTGAGKSNFIDVATRQGGKYVGHGLKSTTTEIRSVRVPHPNGREYVVFVDTPGFDDTTKPDTEILKMIADWLEKTYKRNLSGIIYLHRISDNRMGGSPYRNLRMFGNLCGDQAISNVTLATTMWSRVKPDVGLAREKQLQDKYWKAMLEGGSGTARFVDTYESAWAIVDIILKRDPVDLVLLQEELLNLKLRLGETKAGVALYTELQKSLADQRDTLRKLKQAAEAQNDPQTAKDLEKQCEDIQESLRMTFGELQQMKIPIGRRILLLFTFRKARAHAVRLG